MIGFKNKLNVILLLCLISGFAAAQRQEATVDWGVHPLEYSRVGRSGFQFLKMPVNARYAALGGITTSLGYSDGSSALANPAAMTDVENMQVSFSSMNWIADVGYYSGSIVKRFGNAGMFGISYVAVDYGEMERTEHSLLYDDAGESLGKTSPSFGLGTFTGGDYAVGLSYGRDITDRLKFGTTFKYVHETLDDAKAGVWALDIATIYYTGVRTLRLSMLGQHFGPDAEFLGYDEQIQIPAQRVRLPQVLRFGMAYDILEGNEPMTSRWTVACEFIHPNDGDEKVHFGTEYTFWNFVSLRGGYRFNYDEEGLTVGGAINVITGGYRIGFNYAYIDFGRLNQVHMMSIGLGKK